MGSVGAVVLTLLAMAGASAQAQTSDGSGSSGIVVVGGGQAISGDVLAALENTTAGDVVRVAGANRFATAAAVSEAFREPPAPVVYVATGVDFPDGLVVGPVAAQRGGAVLLVERDSVPDPTRRELERLEPLQVVALGGEQAISGQVLDELTQITGVVAERLWGQTRFSTATAVSRSHFSPGVPLVYIATGWNFPDALSAVPAAAINNAPLLLTDPSGLPGPTIEELERLGPEGIVVLGGHEAVSGQVEQQLAGYTSGRVERIGGAGREATAALISEHAFPRGASTVFIATGASFPDALSIGAVAGGMPGGQPALLSARASAAGQPPGPVLLSRHGSLPAETVAELGRLGHTVPSVAAQPQQVETGFGTPVDITLQASGSGGPLFTYSVTSGPEHGVLSGTAPQLTYTPEPGFHGADTFQFVASDEAATSAPATVTISVHPPGTPTADDQSVNTPFGTPVGITLTGSSPAGLALTYALADEPDDGALSGSAPDLTYTPRAGFHGTDTFTFTVSDGVSTSPAATVTVAVDPPASGGAPPPPPPPPPPTAHDQAVDATIDTPIVITLAADNPRGGPLTYLYTQPADGTVTGTGPDVTYTPDPGFEGMDSFTFQVNDGVHDSNVATVTVSVEPPSPTAANVTESTDQDTPVLITLDADNFSGNPLTYHYDQPSDGTVTGVGPDVTYTPDPGFFGQDTFDYHVNDGFNDSNTATVTVTVHPLPPVAHDVSAATAFETPAVITLDGQSLSGEPLIYEVVDQPANGTAVLVGDGPDVTYTPDPGFEDDDDTFTYRANDSHNDSNTATVTVSVEPQPPSAADVSESTDQDTPVLITLDATSPSGQPLTYHYDQPADGTVTGAGPDVTYTPDPGFFGQNTFDYHVNDGFNDSNTATVTVTVHFTAEDYAFDAVGNTLLEAGVPASGDPAVRVDDTLLDDAEAGFGVTAVDTSGTSGAVTWDADGTFTYAPAAGFTGDDTFIYTISDGSVTGSGAVTVTVSEMVWYVDNQASGDGRSWSPLGSLAGAVTVSGPDDVIFVYEGAGAYTDGVALQAGQTLLGEAAGLTVDGHDLIDAGDHPSIAPSTGDAIALASGVHVQGINVTAGSAGGLVATSVSGSATVADMSISGVTGNAVHVSGGSVALSAAVNVTNTNGHAVRVDGLLGGSVSLSGSVTDTGSGINLTGNTGSTVAFTGQLNVTTTGTPAFAATGGGTVTATGAGSSLSATGARGLQVSSTTIGAAGLRFASISASGSVHGIDVSSAGAGALVVEGDGSALRNGSGGTISGMTSHGVTLSNTGPMTLRNMTITGNTAVGLRAQAVAGLTVIAAGITDNTSDENDPATRNSVWLRNVTGLVRLVDSFVTGSAHNQVDVENTAGTVTIEVERTELNDNGINSGLQVEARGTSNVTLEVSESAFIDHHATGLHAFARDTSTLAVSIDDNTFTGNNVAVNLAAQHTATLSSSVTNNTTAGHASHSINTTVHEDAVHDTTISGNSVDTTATVASVGIRLVAEDDSLMRALVTDNTVTGQTTGQGLRLLSREGPAQVHLTLLDNHIVTTSASPAYSLEILEPSSLCAAVTGNTGSSNHPSRDLFVDLFDDDARGDFEGAPLGPLTAAQLEAHLEAQNPGPRIGSLVTANAFGVAAGACQQPPA